MVMDAVRGYVQLASGLGDVTRARATEIAKSLLAGGRDVPGPGAVKDQVSSLADEIMTQSKANRDLVLTVVRAEVERAVASLGFAASDEVGVLRRRVERLEDQLAASGSAASSGSVREGKAAPAPRPSTASAPKPGPRAVKKTAPRARAAAAPSESSGAASTANLAPGAGPAKRATKKSTPRPAKTAKASATTGTDAAGSSGDA